MKVGEWLQAIQQGLVVHDWAPLKLVSDKHVVELRVSADAVRVVRGGIKVRETAGAYAYQQVADALGALMPTAKILEMRHLAATVRIDPMVAPLVKPGGTVGTVRAAEASAAIDLAMQKTTDVRPGHWLVSNVGKHFVLDRACTETTACNHGFVVKQGDCRANQWRGTPTAESVAAGSAWRVIQRRGTAHGFGPTADQDDYSQTIILVADTCTLDGVEGVPTERLYLEPELAPLVLHDGVALAWSRHPGVPRVGEKPVSVPPPTPRTGGFEELPARKTPASVGDVYAALGRAWQAQLGTAPKHESLCILVAQWAFETGWGKSMWNYNFGNAKTKPQNGATCWTFFACNELLPTAQAVLAFAKAGVRATGTGEKDVVITSSKDGTSTVWFYPNHAASCFRAFRTLDEGAADYFAMIRKRFGSAWPAVEAGDPRQFAHLLKLAKYYTDDEAHYAASLSSVYATVKQKVAASASSV